MKINKSFTQYIDDPSLVLEDIFTQLRDDHDTEVVEASNAFVLLLEASASLTAHSEESYTRQITAAYAPLATTFSDVYRHMSRDDIRRMYSLPGIAPVTVLVNAADFLLKAEQKDGFKEVVIPRHYAITVNNISFTFDRRVSVRVYTNGAIQAKYLDAPAAGVLHSDTCVINDAVITVDNNKEKWFRFTIDLPQIKHIQYHTAISPGIAYSHLIKYDDEVSEVRAYVTSDAGVKQELAISYSDRVFDTQTPTMVVEVDPEVKELRTYIPPMYTLNGKLGGKITTVVTTTLAVVEKNFSSYDIGSYVGGLDDSTVKLDASEHAFINTSSSMFVSGPLQGGRDPLTLQEARDRVMGVKSALALTNKGQDIALTDLGYHVSALNHTLKGRNFLVSSKLPGLTEAETGLTVKSPPSIGDFLLTLSFSELKQLSTAKVFSGGNRITLLPTTLYDHDGHNITPTSAEVLGTLRGLSVSDRITLLKSKKRVFTPFYYGIDITGDIPVVTPWYLNRPVVEYVDYIETNTSSKVIMAVETYTVNTHELGWNVVVGIKYEGLLTNYTADSIFGQISFLDTVGRRVYLEAGIVIEGAKLYLSFNIPSAFELTADALILTDTIGSIIKPNIDIDLVYGLLGNVANYIPNDLQNKVQLSTVDSYKPIAHNRLTTTLGTPLSGLYTDLNILSKDVLYKTYDLDVPMTRTESSVLTSGASDIPYTMDDQCNIIYKPVVTTSKIVTDENGQVVYLHRRGDPVLENGRPVPVDTTQVRFSMKLICMEDHLLFADSKGVIDLLRLIQEDIVVKSTTQLKKLKDQALYMVDYYYLPNKTLGSVVVYRDNNPVGRVDLQLTLAVTLGVNSDTFKNSEVKNRLEETTIEGINTYLKQSVLSKDKLTAYLHEQFKTSVISVQIGGLPDILSEGGVYLADDSQHLSIGNIPAIDEYGRLSIADDIAITFKRI